MEKIKAWECGLNRHGREVVFEIEERLPEEGSTYNRSDVINIQKFNRDVEQPTSSVGDYDLFVVTTFDHDSFNEEMKYHAEDEEELRELYTEQHYVAVERNLAETEEEEIEVGQDIGAVRRKRGR